MQTSESSLLTSMMTSIQRKYGYVDTSLMKKVNGKYTGPDMYNENRKPPVG